MLEIFGSLTGIHADSGDVRLQGAQRSQQIRGHGTRAEVPPTHPGHGRGSARFAKVKTMQREQDVEEVSAQWFRHTKVMI